MAPAVIGHHGFAAAGIEFGVQGIERIQAGFKPLDLAALAHHGVEQPAHQLQHPLLQFVGPAGRSLLSAVGHR